MTYEQIRELINSRMASFPGVTREQIDYPNQPEVFTPPATGLWCRLNIQHATAFMAGMADRPYTRKPGQINIQCFARERTGTKAINELADALEVHFAYWMSGDLECREASQVVAGEFEGFYQINVNIRFRAG
ncbi:phage tail terminator-like protein [Pseudomonas sp. Irchel 3E20]|uniref:phage tail terminator-like protein n=1 Tax=Pseudomonas sp. Irchel 3E20 TaxID=2008983 RepID=UPI000BA2D94E|nr:phage tail terminator-like protein [Pseudomonas sp. Irchel 3E20]